MRNFFNKLLTGIIIFSIITIVHATEPVWTFMPLTPTSVSLPSSQTTPVFIKYKITNQSKKLHTLRMKPIPGIFQDSSASGSCPHPFTLATFQSCILTLRIIGTELPNSVFGGPIVCQQGSALQCYQPNQDNRLKIIKEKSATYTIGGSIIGLSINGLVLQNNGGDSLAVPKGATSFQFATKTSGNYNVTILQQPPGLTCIVSNGSGTNVMADVTTVSVGCAPSFSYVADESQQVWQCPMDLLTGTFEGSCTALTNFPVFFQTTSMTLQSFNGSMHAYVSDFSNTLWQCPISRVTGTFNGSCNALTNSPSFNETTSVAFKSFNATMYAYVADRSSIIWQCPVNAATGAFNEACTALTNSPAFVDTFAINFQIFNGHTYAYVTDLSNTIWQCPINTTTGAFSGACIALTNTPSFFNVNNIIFHSFNGTTYGYVSDGSAVVWQCPINTSTGTFNGSCIALTNNPAFFLTGSMAIQQFNNSTYAYVADDSNTLWQCPLNTSTGSFSPSCIGLTNSPEFIAAQFALFSFF